MRMIHSQGNGYWNHYIVSWKGVEKYLKDMTYWKGCDIPGAVSTSLATIEILDTNNGRITIQDHNWTNTNWRFGMWVELNFEHGSAL